jgi:hypothetical protein
MTRRGRWTLVSALTAAAVAVTASVVYAAGTRKQESAPLAVAQDVQPAAPQVTGDNCKLPRTDFTTSSTGQSTTSSTFIDMVDMQDTFTQGGRAPACVVVSFSSETIGSVNATMVIRALLDGTISPSPAEITVFQADAELGRGTGARTANFVFPSVAPGTHTVKIQFREIGGEDLVQVNDRSLLVHHR